MKSILASLLPALAVVCALSAEAARKPNVILFLVDDMGWMDSTPSGSQYYDTPIMERLARESMRFTQAYSQPLCSPTRASLLTGQYSARHGVTSASGHQPPQPPGHAFLPEKAPANQPLLMPERRGDGVSQQISNNCAHHPAAGDRKNVHPFQPGAMRGEGTEGLKKGFPSSFASTGFV